MLVRIILQRTNSILISMILMCILLASHAYAQISGATLSGTVTDQSGGVVPQATISIKNVATDIMCSNTASAAHPEPS
jgi:hypothetical protein